MGRVNICIVNLEGMARYGVGSMVCARTCSYQESKQQLILNDVNLPLIRGRKAIPSQAHTCTHLVQILLGNSI